MGGIVAGTGYNSPAPYTQYQGSKLSNADVATAFDQGNIQRAQNQSNFNQNFGNFGSFMSKYFPDATGSSTTLTGTGAGGVNGPITQVPGMGTVATWTPQALPPMPSMPSPQSTSDLAFAKAKDQVGSSLSGLTKALGDQFNSRGIGNSSLAGSTIADALVRGNGQLAGVATDQAIKNTDTANDFAKTAFQGALEGRGQNIGAMEHANDTYTAQRGQNITERGQDLDAAARAAQLRLQTQQDRLASITGLWKAFAGGNGSSLF